MAIDRQAMKERFKDGIAVAKEKVAVFADDAKDKTRDSIDKLKDAAVEGSVKLNDAKNDLDRKIYNPLSEEMLQSEEFVAPRLVRLLETNPHSEKEACKEAVGFNSLIAKNKVLELIKDVYPEEQFKFYPNLSEQIYLRNPYVENMYISLNAYFDYIKKARVAELVMVANKLGAKYVKITYKETEKRFVSANVEKQENIGGVLGKNKAGNSEKAKANASYGSLREIEVASETEFNGHDVPIRPELVYFKGEIDIESFIDLCLGDNPPKSKSYTIKYNRSADLSLEAAAGIDAVLGKLKMGASASVKSEVEKENRMYLEYEIKF